MSSYTLTPKHKAIIKELFNPDYDTIMLFLERGRD
jgi:hypothetical protein